MKDFGKKWKKGIDLLTNSPIITIITDLALTNAYIKLQEVTLRKASMEGLSKDAASNGTGRRKYWKSSGNWLRNRLGERNLIPVALSLFAVFLFRNHLLKKFYRSIRFAATFSFKGPGIQFFVGLFLILSAEKVGAVPICENNLNCTRYSIESNRASWDLYGYNLVGLPFSARVYGSFNEGDNIEWIYYALEDQYAFLDDTLYRITGGCYFLGSVYYPLWHGFRYYYCLGDPDREIIYISGNSAAYTNNAQSGDIIASAALDEETGRGHSPVDLRKMPGRIYPGNGHEMDTETVPELSSLILFGLAALRILRSKKIGGKL